MKNELTINNNTNDVINLINKLSINNNKRKFNDSSNFQCDNKRKLNDSSNFLCNNNKRKLTDLSNIYSNNINKIKLKYNNKKIKLNYINYFNVIGENSINDILNMLHYNDIKRLLCTNKMWQFMDDIYLEEYIDISIDNNNNKFKLFNINLIINGLEFESCYFLNYFVHEKLNVKSITIGNIIFEHKFCVLNNIFKLSQFKNTNMIKFYKWGNIFNNNNENLSIVINNIFNDFSKLKTICFDTCMIDHTILNLPEITNFKEIIIFVNHNEYKTQSIYHSKYDFVDCIIINSLLLLNNKISNEINLLCNTKIIIDFLVIYCDNYNYFLNMEKHKQFYVKNLVIDSIVLNDEITDIILSLCDENYLEGISIHHADHMQNMEVFDLDLSLDDDYKDVPWEINKNKNILRKKSKIINFSKLLKFVNLKIIKFYNCNEIRYSYNIEIFKNFLNLDTISFNNCVLTTSLLKILSEIKQLKVLSITKDIHKICEDIHSINDEYKHFNKPENDLEIINIDYYECIKSVQQILPKIDFSILSEITNLTHLTISDNRLEDHHLKDFNKLTKIEELIIHMCLKISNEGILNISKITNLKSLKIYGNISVDINGFEILWNSSNLNNLYLSRMYNMFVYLYILNIKIVKTNLKKFEYDYYYEKNHLKQIEYQYDESFDNNILVNKLKGINFIDINNINSMNQYKFNFNENVIDLSFTDEMESEMHQYYCIFNDIN